MKNYKILIVDDSIQNLKTMISIIERHHPAYLIYQANNGKTALRVMESVTPDIILTDWEMPGMSGIELIGIIKKSPEAASIPVIVVSGVMVTADDLKTAIEAGAVDYVRKPIIAVELLARMHSALIIAENHKSLVREKESKIVDNVILSNEVNTFLKKLACNIKELKADFREHPSSNKLISDMLLQIEVRLGDQGWHRFSLEYDKIHPEYQKKLLKIHPDLTPAELKLSAMLRLGLSNKELAALLFVTPESMRVSRSRLRKKLGLQQDQNLQTYLLAV